MAWKSRNGRFGLEQGSHWVTAEEISKPLRAPAYVYDLDDILSRIEKLKAAFTRSIGIRYAMKANANPCILKLMADSGVGADVVSWGEFHQALEAGIPPKKIIFSGVGKEVHEIEEALRVEVGQINVESLPELRRIISIARNMGKEAPVALRVNPNIDAETHPHIATGLIETKFGIPVDQVSMALQSISEHRGLVRFQGLAVHLGSQIKVVSAFQRAGEELCRLVRVVRQLGLSVESIDLGGGLGIDYDKDDEALEFGLLRDYALAVESGLKDFGGQVLLEPGRFLVAHAGILLTQVQYVKRSGDKTFVILNSGMNHLMRPVLYGARHRIEKIVEGQAEAYPAIKRVDVVGPLCETADTFAKDIEFPMVTEGEWLAIRDCGAYGFVMAMTYNGRPLPREIAYSSGRPVQR